MTSHLIQGSNDAERILKGGDQTNHGNKMAWISNTDNRGAPGRRESHAEGDSVGEEVSHHRAGGFLGNVARGVGKVARTANNIRKTVQPIAKAGAEAYATKGASLLRAQGGRVDREQHAYGDVAGQQYPGQQPRQQQAIGQTVQPNNQVSQQQPNQQPIEQQQQMSRGGAAGYKRGF